MKWPSGVPVFESYLFGRYQVVTGVDVVASYRGMHGYVATMDSLGYCHWRRPDEVEALNADARAMLAIAREGK